MIDTTPAFGSLALSGTTNFVVALNTMTQQFELQLNALYAAVAATSGLQAAFTVCVDGSGTNFIASNVPNQILKPAATVKGSSSTLMNFGTELRVDGGSISHVKVVLTNLDATNAVSYAALVEQAK